MAIGKNKRLTKCVAASGVDSEESSELIAARRASRAAARSADRQPTQSRRQQRQLSERRRAAGGEARPSGRADERSSGPHAAAVAHPPRSARRRRQPPHGRERESPARGARPRRSPVTPHRSKKGGKKKAVDPFLKKEWYEIKTPSMFSVRNCGKTLVTRTQGTKIASDALKGRVFEISLGDLNNDEDQTYRKIKLICEDVQGYNCLTNFHGMGMTRDKLASLIKKWQTLVEGNVDVKTTDGYTLRMFAIGFTTKMPNQVSKMCYANSAQVRQIRKKMVDVMREEASKCDLKDLVLKLIPEYMGGEIEKACAGIFPMQNVFVRKVKVLKKPKFDLVKLMELHSGEGAEDSGDKAEGDAEEVVAAEKDITQAASGGRL